MSDDGYSDRLEERTAGDRSRYDRLFDLLSEHRRRVVLRHVAEQPIVTVEELAAIVSEEEGTPAERAATSLRHSDLPALTDAGIVEYDPRSATVRYDGHEFVETALALVPGE